MSLIFHASIEDVFHHNAVPTSFKLSTGHFCNVRQSTRDGNFMMQLKETMSEKAWKALDNDYDSMIHIAIKLRVPFKFEYGVVHDRDGTYRSAVRFA